MKRYMMARAAGVWSVALLAALLCGCSALPTSVADAGRSPTPSVSLSAQTSAPAPTRTVASTTMSCAPLTPITAATPAARITLPAGALPTAAPPKVGDNGQVTPNAPGANGGTLPGLYFYVQDYSIWQAGTRGGGAAPAVTALGGKQLTQNPDLSFAKDPALSPDGTRLAYAYSPPPMKINGRTTVGQDIDLLDLRTGAVCTLVARTDPFDYLETPMWSGDMRYVYYGRQGTLYDKDNRVTGQTHLIERFDTVTQSRETLVADGMDEAVSPDGKTLAFVTINDAYELGFALYDIGGKKTTRLDRPALNFVSYATPRFSPDGSLLAFSAVGGPGVDLGALQPPTPAALRPAFTFAALRRPIALPSLHGTPYDLWLWPVAPLASTPRRLTTLYEDQPVPAWSKDGTTIGFIAGNGLYSITPSGTGLKRYAERGSHGGFAWSGA